MRWTLTVLDGPETGRRFEVEAPARIVIGAGATADLRIKDGQSMGIAEIHVTLEFETDSDSVQVRPSAGCEVAVGASELPPDGSSMVLANEILRVGGVRLQLVRGAWETQTATGDLDATPNPASPLSAPPPSPESFAPPGYEFIRVIGRGGMGIVSLVRNTSTGKLHAAKMIIPAAAQSEKALQFFLRESSIHSQLEHPRIVQFGHVGIFHGILFFIMDYIETIDIEFLLKSLDPEMRVKAACLLARQVLDALRFAHAKGFVHRDVKPSNILVSQEGGNKLRARLTDFGLARDYLASGLSGITAPEDFRGTWRFAAPEITQNARLAKPSADIYSMGATLHWYLTGKSPNALTATQTHDVARVAPDLPPGLAAVVDRALAYHPADRFESADAMFDSLAPFIRP